MEVLIFILWCNVVHVYIGLTLFQVVLKFYVLFCVHRILTTTIVWWTTIESTCTSTLITTLWCQHSLLNLFKEASGISILWRHSHYTKQEMDSWNFNYQWMITNFYLHNSGEILNIHIEYYVKIDFKKYLQTLVVGTYFLFLLITYLIKKWMLWLVGWLFESSLFSFFRFATTIHIAWFCRV